jgi:hypothetical protein
MAHIKKLAVAQSGCIIELDRKGGRLRLRQGNKQDQIDVFPDQANTDGDFVPFATIPESPHLYFFFRMDALHEELVLPPNTLKYVNGGRSYQVPVNQQFCEALKIPWEPHTLMAILCGFSEQERCSVLVMVGPGRPPDLSETECFLGVLDILGYRNRIQQTPLDDFVKSLQALLDEIRLAVRLSRLSVLETESEPGFDPELNEPLNAALDDVRLDIVSDTVIVRARSREVDEGLPALCKTMMCLIDFGLSMGWLFRGAIDVGPFIEIPEHRIFAGQGLVWAYDLEHNQDWSGCQISSRIISRFPETVEFLIKDGVFCVYPIPLKKCLATSEHLVALNWCLYSFQTNRLDQLQKLRTATSDPAALRKIDGTREFVSEMRRRKLESAAELSFKVG